MLLGGAGPSGTWAGSAICILLGIALPLLLLRQLPLHTAAAAAAAAAEPQQPAVERLRSATHFRQYCHQQQQYSKP
jgi:hypothetical protein